MAVKKKKTTTKKTTTKKAANKKSAAKKVSKKTATKKTAKKATAKITATSSGGSKVYGITVGDELPEFATMATSNKQVTSSSLKGRKVVMYFYPRDNTPGCTLEGQDFRRLYQQFKKYNCEIFGVSQDSLQSHESFKSKCDFPFDLLLDEDGKICRAFDVIQMKNNYGKTYEGIERSTFVIDVNGQIAGERRKVKVEGHADAVLQFVEQL